MGHLLDRPVLQPPGQLHQRPVAAFQAAGKLALSVDTKKMLVGDFKNGGRQQHPTGQSEPVRVHGFVIPEFRKANIGDPSRCERPALR
jgi:hypothetical protein